MTDWRVARSLLVLLAEINTAHPGRDMRTDGTISGYPGARSSHNINAEGVVCALDITTGLYPGGITPAQGITLADKIRVALRDQPRGIPTYVIHNSKIASAGDNYGWLPYVGPDPHTSHIHVSVDWDIYAGGAPSSQADYDSSLPWGIATTPTSKDGFTVSEATKIIAILTENQRRITNTRDIVTENQRRITNTRDIVTENQRRTTNTRAEVAGLRSVLDQLSKNQGVAIDYALVTAAVKAGLVDGTVSVDINVNGAVQ